MPDRQRIPDDAGPYTAAADADWWAKTLGQRPDPATSADGDDTSSGPEMLDTSEGIDRRSVEDKLAATETRRRQAQALLEKNAARLTELEEERAVVLGESKLAERRAADLEEHLEQLRQDLAAVEAAEAHQAMQEAVRGRDAALANAAELAAQLAGAIEAIGSARAKTREAHQRARQLDPAHAAGAIPPEPREFDERWRALAPMVEAELGVRLESELVEAAARTPNYLVLESLPEHLQELARQRKRELLIKAGQENRERANAVAATKEPQ